MSPCLFPTTITITLLHPPLSLSLSLYIYIYIYISKVGDRDRGQPEGFVLNSYYTEMLGRALLTLDLYPIILSVKEAGIKCYFLSLWYDDVRLNPGLSTRVEQNNGNTWKFRSNFSYGFLITALPWNPALCSSLLTVFEEIGFSRWSLATL